MIRRYSLFAAGALLFGATFNPASAVSLSGAGDSDTDTMAVSMTVVDACEFSVSDVAFGSQGLVSTSTTSDGALSISCTDGTAFSVTFETGQTMTDGTNIVPYGLALIGTPTLVGTGEAESIGYRATLAPTDGVSPPAGAYADTTDVTVAIAP